MDNNVNTIKQKGFGALHKYANEKYANMPFNEVKKIAIEKHIEERYGKQGQFIVEDKESLKRELEYAERDLKENGAPYGNEIFDEIRRKYKL